MVCSDVIAMMTVMTVERNDEMRCREEVMFNAREVAREVRNVGRERVGSRRYTDRQFVRQRQQDERQSQMSVVLRRAGKGAWVV